MIRIGYTLLLVTLLAAAASQAANIDNGLIAWYPFDDGAIDKTGNVEPVGTGRGLQIVAGKFGGAVHLDGKSYVTIPVDLNPDVIPDTTISMWVKTDPPPDDPALAKQLPNALFVLSESIGLSNLGNDSTYFYARSLNNSVVGPKHVVRRGQWQHVALVRWIEDRPGRDGNKIPHVVSQLHTGGRMTESAVPFKGQDMHVDLYLGTGSPRYEHMFRGAVDELRIYDRALSEEEIGLLAKAKVSAFPGDQFEGDPRQFPGDQFEGGPTQFPGDQFEGDPAQFPGDQFEPGENALPGNTPTTDSSALNNVNSGDVSLVDMAVDNPVNDNRGAATPNTTLPDANNNPSIIPPNQTADDFQERMDDPDFQDSLKAVDWNVKGMIPLTAEDKANIYPGSVVNIKIRVDKDDPANHMPDVKLALKGDQTRAESVPLRVMTSEQIPTARRDIPMTITIPEDFAFEQEDANGIYHANTWLLAADGRPLQDAVTDNNSRSLSIPVLRPMQEEDCGGVIANDGGTRTATGCLRGNSPQAPYFGTDSQFQVSANGRVFTSISGEHHTSGTSSQTTGPNNGLMVSLTIGEKADKPCYLESESNQDPARLFDRCGGKFGEHYRILVPIDSAMTAIKVCQRKSNKRVKGLMIQSRQIDANGTLSDTAIWSAPVALANCNKWATPARCPDGKVAAGMQASFYADGRISSLKGIGLICGNIVLSPESGGS